MKQDQAARTAAVYDASAAAYERHWAPVLLRHSRDLVALVTGSAEARRVLEVGAGTGGLLPELVRAAGPGGTVVALDRSLGMLRRAPATVPRVQADALALPVRSESFDVAVAAFVLFLLPDARGGAAELCRVVRPGGELLVATWGEAPRNQADQLMIDVLDAADAPVPEPAPDSEDLTDSAEKLSALLEGAGFVEVRTGSRPLESRLSPEAHLDMRMACGFTAWRLARLAPEEQREVHERLAREYAALDAEAFRDDAEVLLTTARRPR